MEKDKSTQVILGVILVFWLIFMQNSVNEVRLESERRIDSFRHELNHIKKDIEWQQEYNTKQKTYLDAVCEATWRLQDQIKKG